MFCVVVLVPWPASSCRCRARYRRYPKGDGTVAAAVTVDGPPVMEVDSVAMPVVLPAR